MDFKKEFESFKKMIELSEKKTYQIMKDREEWCQDNRKKIKDSMFPKTNSIYKIELSEKERGSYYLQNYDNEEQFYFKPKDTRFVPGRYMDKYQHLPSVMGELLDSNSKVVTTNYRIEVTALEEVKRVSSNNFTKVYVMIDKNTGFYKIGRSKTPFKREKTLQSEKPTIEMLFHHEARVKDEKVLHKEFAEKRIRGEWFDLNGSDLIKIKEYFTL